MYVYGKIGDAGSETPVARRENEIQLDNEMAREYQYVYVHLASLSTTYELLAKSDPVRMRDSQSQNELVVNMFGLLCCSLC